MSKWICSICGYVYDEAKEGKAFTDLPDTWVCPWCGAPKSAFVPEKQEAAPKAPVAPVELDGEMVKLSAGELSALCSNLARGCEKQYQEPEAALFKELADFFAAATPLEPGAELGRLAELFQEDLTAGYPADLRMGGKGDQHPVRLGPALPKGRGSLPGQHPGVGMHGVRLRVCGGYSAGVMPGM